MIKKETRVQKIVRLTAKHFSLFGNEPPTFAAPIFAAGVDIERVVRFILAKQNALERAGRAKIGNDARDILYTSGLLKPLSSEALGKVPYLRRREIVEQLRNKAYPFSRLSKKKIGVLLHLPPSWIREGALWQLNVR